MCSARTIAALVGLWICASACSLDRSPLAQRGDGLAMQAAPTRHASDDRRDAAQPAEPESDASAHADAAGTGPQAGDAERDAAAGDFDAAANDADPTHAAGGDAAVADDQQVDDHDDNPSEVAERCDGKDNDDDGEIDEDLGEIECGVGACKVRVARCDHGEKQQCTALAAGDELCGNHIDDDCDGHTDESADVDGDGFSLCDGDCCDVAGACGDQPALVNPGAFEVLGNDVDDDCDPSSDDEKPETCGPAALQTPTSAGALAQALDLCRFTTPDPEPGERTWGVISATLLAADHVSAAPADVQTGVLSDYGANVMPRRGATMAAISTGTARDESDKGFVLQQYSWDKGSSGAPPAAYLAAHGGSLPAAEDCPDNEKANDSVALALRVRVPTNAHSFALRFKLFSAEYPEWYCHDYFVALLTTNADGIPADHDIARMPNGSTIALDTNAFDECEGASQCSAGPSALIGTGMERDDDPDNKDTHSDGAATDWFTASAPVEPGEEMRLELVVWDAGDHWFDTVVLLDGFEWRTDPAQAGSTR